MSLKFLSNHSSRLLGQISGRFFFLCWTKISPLLFNINKCFAFLLMSTLVRFTAAAVIIISVFGCSVIAVAFQIAFRVEIHANDIFFIF